MFHSRVIENNLIYGYFFNLVMKFPSHYLMCYAVIKWKLSQTLSYNMNYIKVILYMYVTETRFIQHKFDNLKV